jgi:protein gp37
MRSFAQTKDCQTYPNVWLGVTCGAESSLNQVELLKKLPAQLRFISAEPLLGPIDFRPYLDGYIHWIITGCEQAAKTKRRPMDNLGRTSGGIQHCQWWTDASGLADSAVQPNDCLEVA